MPIGAIDYKVDMDVLGGRTIATSLDNFKFSIPRTLDNILYEIGVQSKTRARQLAPVESGKLKSQIRFSLESGGNERKLVLYSPASRKVEKRVRPGRDYRSKYSGKGYAFVYQGGKAPYGLYQEVGWYDVEGNWHGPYHGRGYLRWGMSQTLRQLEKIAKREFGKVGGKMLKGMWTGDIGISVPRMSSYLSKTKLKN